MIDIVSSVTRVNDIMGEMPLRRKNNSGGLSRLHRLSANGSGDSAERLAGRRSGGGNGQLANQADHLSSRVAVFTLEDMK